MTRGNSATNTDQSEDGRKHFVTVGTLHASLRARLDAQRSYWARLADTLTAIFGGMTFLLVNCLWFAIWIVVNLGWVPGIPVFDPFPFGLLTMVVSLEAIVLAIVVLISQNRAAAIAELREEMTLQVGEITERELTKVLALTTRLLEAQGVDISEDQELMEMLQETNTEEIIKELEEEIGGGLRSEKETPASGGRVKGIPDRT